MRVKERIKIAIDRVFMLNKITYFSSAFIASLLIIITGCTDRVIRWSTEVGPPDGGKYRGVAAGDFNGDGNIDLVGGSYLPGGTYVYLGRGDGTWLYNGKASDIGEIRSMESADFNEDGYDDIVITTWGDLKGVHVYFSDGKGKWWEELPPEESWSYEGVDIGDLNNDGHMDIIAANSTSEVFGGISAWFGNGNGFWTVDYGPSKGEVYKDVCVADFNQDGYMDIAATSWGVHGSIKVWYGNGRGDWRAAPAPPHRADYWGIDAEDFNNDGYPDIAAGTYMEGLAVWYGGPHHGFRKWDHLKMEGSYWGVLARDFDGDGYVDIMASSFDGAGMLFMHNDGNTGWTDLSEQFPIKDNYFGLTSADINRDGLTDLIAAHPGEGLHVWVQGYGDDILVDEAFPVEGTNLFLCKSVLKTDKERRFSIYFDTADTTIRLDQYPEFNSIVTVLKNYPESIVWLEGNADPRSAELTLFKSNIELSERRASAVMYALIDSSGLNRSQFSITAFGDTRILSKDSTGYQTDRRTDVIVLPKRFESKVHFRGRADDALLLSDSYVEAAAGSMAVEAVENIVYTTISGFPEYKVGPGDVLRISLWEGRNIKEYLVTVQIDGTISFAYTQNVEVADLSTTQIRAKLIEESKEYYRRPNINIDVLEYNACKASVLGEIRDLQRTDTGPGQYPLMGKTYIVDFISRHGGPKPSADLAQVKLVRAKGHTFYLNLYKAMFEGDVKENVILDHGDVIFLPSLEVSPRKFYVLGEVNSPGVYELKDEVNILEALIIGGSFTDRAAISSIAIIRGELTKPEVVLVNLEALIKNGDQSENVEIRDGDIIFVPRHFIGNVNYVMGQLLPSLNTLFLIDRIR